MDHNIQLARQKDIITILTFSPSIFAKYVHYNEERVPGFYGVPFDIPPIPFISYNNKEVCAIVSAIISNREKVNNWRITKLSKSGKVASPYTITDNRNNTLFFKVSKLTNLHCKYAPLPATDIIEAAVERNKLVMCLGDIPLNKLQYLVSDEFTNETLIAYCLTYMATQRTLPPLFLQHYQGYVCPEPDTDNLLGINITEFCDLGGLDDLPNNPNFACNLHKYAVTDCQKEFIRLLVAPEALLQILTQVTVGLYILQAYLNFTSGDLKAGNIFVSSKPLNTEYLGIKLKATFTCKIGDFGKSSCTVKRRDGTGVRWKSVV